MVNVAYLIINIKSRKFRNTSKVNKVGDIPSIL